MKRNEKGFSLIELLVGMAIIITTTTIVLSIIVSSFRISGKTTSNSTVRQNGNYALAQMTKQLKFADSFQGVSQTESGPAVTSCDSEMTYEQIDFKYNGVDKSLICNDSTLTIDGESSIDTNKITIKSCSLKCSQEGSDGPIINIKFGLTTDAVDGSTVVEDSATINFSTTVKMRN